MKENFSVNQPDFLVWVNNKKMSFLEEKYVKYYRRTLLISHSRHGGLEVLHLLVRLLTTDQ